jgi:hypothetical protein
MRKDLEDLHKILGEVCGEICMALVLCRVTGGKSSVRKWLDLTRRAVDLLEKMAA